MTFYAYELELCSGFGLQVGTAGLTEIQSQRNQHERRNAVGDVMRHSFILTLNNVAELDYIQKLKTAHLMFYAQAHSFLVKDPLDYQCTAESLGSAPSGTQAVQLTKTYGIPGIAQYVRNITKPVVGAVVYQNGIAKTGTLDTLTGLFTPTTSWSAGQPLTWTGEFRVPVRFNSDFVPVTVDSKGGGTFRVNGSVELIEVFGE
jgi:uncharacterized protein (TIGR02217 family)